MRFLLKAFFTLATLVVLAIGAAYFLIPQDVVRDQVTSLVREQTGRTLTVRGKTSFQLFPAVGVELGDVTLSGPPEMKGPPMLRMASLTLNLKLMPLFSRQIEIERFVLGQPVFDLRVDEQGRRNWDFARKQAARGDAVKAVAQAPRFVQAQAGGLGGGLVEEIRLGEVRIVDGVVIYADATTGTRQQLDAVNVSLTQERLSEPLNAEGDLVWRGEAVALKGQLASVSAVTRGGPSAVAAEISSRHAKGSYNGRVVFGDAVSADGDVKGDTPSVRALAAWVGNALPHGKGLGPASVTGHIKYQGDVLTFSKTRFALDGMNGQGNGSVSFKGARPYLRAAFALDKLDLNAYRGPAGPPPAARQQRAPQQPRPQGSAPKPGQSLTDFIKDLNQTEPKPEVRAWSERALDLTGLKAIDADVNVNAGALHFDQIRVGKSSVQAALKNGLLTANLTRLALYGGGGTGRITLNGARAVPALAAAFDIRGVSALPFLKDAMQFDWVSGKANLAVNLSGSGRSESQIVRTLQGNGSLLFTDGAIEGVNIPAMIRGIKQGQFRGWDRDQGLKTDFSRLSGSFTMQGGVATNSDLSLTGPLVRMTGQGVVNVPLEQLDFSLTPRLVASLEGQGSQQQLDGLVVPVRVHGPWAKPRITPDLQKILENPELAKDAVDKVGKTIKQLKDKKITGKDVEQILQGVLGGGQQQPQAQPANPAQGAQPQPQPQPQQQIRPEDLLKQLLKKN